MDLQDNSNLDGKMVSAVGTLFTREKSISSIKDLYESDSYPKVSSIIRENNDLLILSSLDLEKMCDFIKLSHFEVTEEKIKFLASRIIKDSRNDAIDILIDSKEKRKNEIRKIEDAIIHKASNKNEYKELRKFANLFIRLADIEQEIEKRKQDLEKVVQEQELLMQKRQEFFNILYDMNEYAQENVPSRTLVKNIKFKK